jgi:hypothetical protein
MNARERVAVAYDGTGRCDNIRRTALFGNQRAAICWIASPAWLTSISFCVVNGARPLLIAAAAFFPVGIPPLRM